MVKKFADGISYAYMFVDKVRVRVSAGNGGNGLVSWCREKFKPKGGPWGGDGGDGGDVVLVCDVKEMSLSFFRDNRVMRGGDGRGGGPNRKHGKRGKDLVLKVPENTVVSDVDSGEEVCEVKRHGDMVTILRGGKGGKGNANFKTSVRQAPYFATDGEKGEEGVFDFELKLFSDVGLVGFPNAGKSMLMKMLTKCNVVIGDYEFTTLYPNLGFVVFEDYRRALISDIPGIVDGAHENRGLGLEFLRHIEKSRILVYVLDASGGSGRSPYGDYCALRKEIAFYDKNILEKPFIIVLNKSDVAGSEKVVEDFFLNCGGRDSEEVVIVSAVTGDNGDRLVKKLKSKLFL